MTDPPYALTSIVKRFGNSNPADVARNVTDKIINGQGANPYTRAASGFMGKKWDTGETAFDPAFWANVMRVLKPGGHLIAFGGTRTYHRLAVAIEDAGFEIRDQIGWLYGSGFPKSHNQGNGWGTALKPAWEPIVMARKPLIGTVAANVLEHGTGAINVDGCRIGEDVVGWGGARGGSDDPTQSKGRSYRLGEGAARPVAGRWPANLIHDGSEEVLAAFPETDGQLAAVGPQHGAKKSVNTYGDYGPRELTEPRGDSGSAARFFYSAKADAGDRLGSKHPTVKPVDLMAYLCRLITPTGGTVLDPFAGSGTTGMACMREGFNAILIEREAEYVADIKRRIAHVSGQDAPLFAGGK